MWQRVLLLLLTLLGLFACNPSKNKGIDSADLSFQTDESSKLFFKNVRQLYYDKEMLEAAKLEVFRLKKREQSDKMPVINLSIVNNWRYDEAYVLLEPNAAAGDVTQLRVRWESSEDSGEINFERGNKVKHLEFAWSIYAHILEQCRFQIYLDGEWKDVLNTEKAREAFRITMFDYFRLTRQL